jgi:acyl-CoA thioesterase
VSPREIVTAMMERDAFSRWLGIKVIEVSEKTVTLEMTVTGEMLNGFGMAHGGITFSFADSALAFASNAGGTKSVSIDTSISHFAPVNSGDKLYAVAHCDSESTRIGHYTIQVTRGTPEGPAVAVFRGTVYRKREQW